MTEFRSFISGRTDWEQTVPTEKRGSFCEDEGVYQKEFIESHVERGDDQ